MKTFKFEDFKEQFGSKEVEKPKQITIKPVKRSYPTYNQTSYPKLEIPADATPEDIEGINMLNSMSYEERKKVDDDTKKMMDWILNETFLIVYLLKRPELLTMSEKLILGYAVRRFAIEFKFTPMEAIKFFNAYKDKIRRDLSSVSVPDKNEE